jgi:hypothetical protein
MIVQRYLNEGKGKVRLKPKQYSKSEDAGDRFWAGGTPDCEEHPTQRLPVLIPEELNPSQSSSPTSSELSELPFWLSSSDNSESLSSVQ